MFNPAFLGEMLPPFSGCQFVSVGDGIIGGKKCVGYVGKVSSILANQTYRKVRGNRS